MNYSKHVDWWINKIVNFYIVPLILRCVILSFTVCTIFRGRVIYQRKKTRFYSYGSVFKKTQSFFCLTASFLPFNMTLRFFTLHYYPSVFTLQAFGFWVWFMRSSEVSLRSKTNPLKLNPLKPKVCKSLIDSPHPMKKRSQSNSIQFNFNISLFATLLKI